MRETEAWLKSEIAKLQHELKELKILEAGLLEREKRLMALLHKYKTDSGSLFSKWFA
ncbi:MAG: hypothetical protein M0Q44_01920 [Methylobacter sp.]|jgi:hypothetical protein|nr:hypothetical protein [Methylobacter sp.]